MPVMVEDHLHCLAEGVQPSTDGKKNGEDLFMRKIIDGEVIGTGLN
jgi:hypothetical protein